MPMKHVFISLTKIIPDLLTVGYNSILSVFRLYAEFAWIPKRSIASAIKHGAHVLAFSMTSHEFL